MQGDRPLPTLTALRRDAAEVPSVRVTVVPPDGVPLEAVLGVMPLVVGTSPDCDLVIVDPKVSRRHCQIALTDQGIVLEDLGSKNGTFIENVRVMQALLAPLARATV